MWRAILLSTLLLVPAYLALLTGLVSVALDDAVACRTPARTSPSAWRSCPFVFVALAFLSAHPRAPAAVAWAMVLTLAVGIPISALAADAVTGFVAGIGAGGIVGDASGPRSLLEGAGPRGARRDALWVFVTVRVMPEAALLLAPVLPFTGIGVADHLLEIRRERRAGPHPPTERG